MTEKKGSTLCARRVFTSIPKGIYKNKQYCMMYTTKKLDNYNYIEQEILKIIGKNK